jgi:hypothetical protein
VETEQTVLQDYYADAGDKAPRYYQVNAAIEAIAKGRNRVASGGCGKRAAPSGFSASPTVGHRI